MIGGEPYVVKALAGKSWGKKLPADALRRGGAGGKVLISTSQGAMPTEGMIIMTTTAKTLTTAEVAEALGTDPRTLRKFLRSEVSGIEGVGKGARYSLPATKTALTAMGKKFSKWAEAEENARNERKAAKAAEADIDAEGDEELDED